MGLVMLRLLKTNHDMGSWLRLILVIVARRNFTFQQVPNLMTG